MTEQIEKAFTCYAPKGNQAERYTCMWANAGIARNEG